MFCFESDKQSDRRMSVKQEPKSQFLKEGSYGCTFTPPLPCKSSTKSKKKERLVGKIIKQKNAAIELSLAGLVKSIPGWDRYFVVQEEDECRSKNFELLRGYYESKCKIFKKESDSSLVQLLSPYAGRTVFEYTPTETFDFLGSLEHVLEGVAKLGQQGICHFDLSTANILIDFKGTMKIIDFGIAFLGDEVTEDVVRRHTHGSFSPDYMPQPPELAIQTALHHNISFSEALTQVAKKKKEFVKAQNLLGISLVHQLEELGEFWKEQEEWKGGSWVPFFHKYWRTWDSWAVGTVFLSLLEKCFLLEKFVGGQWKEDGALIRTVLKGLLHSSPTKRMTAEEALKIIKMGH
jgi:serine/threonine protein kinase